MSEKTFNTMDLGEATALVVVGYNLIDLEPSSVDRPKQRVFIFEMAHPSMEYPAGKTAETDARAYRKHDLLIDAYGYFLAMRELKSRIYADNGTYRSG